MRVVGQFLKHKHTCIHTLGSQSLHESVCDNGRSACRVATVYKGYLHYREREVQSVSQRCEHIK